MKGLVVEDKTLRVANYHKHTVESFVELLGATGLDRPDKINRTHVYRRVLMNQVKTYAEIFPILADGCLLNETDLPIDYADYMKRASAESFEA